MPYGDRPLARVREYVTLLQACLSGETVDFDGDFYQVKGFRLGVRLGERRPKIVVGALNPGMLRLAGELADGVLLNYLPASARALVGRAGPRRAATPRSTPTSTPACASARTASSYARRDLFSYAVVDAYARNFERAGFGDEVAEIRARHADGDRDGARGRGERPHGRRHRRHGRRRHGARDRAGLRRRRRRGPRAHAAAVGPTGARRPRPPSGRARRR